MTLLESLLEQSQLISDIITTYAVTPLLIFFSGLALAAMLRNAVRAGMNAVQADMRFRSTLPFSPSNTAANITFVVVALVSTALALASVGTFTFVISRILFFLSWLGLLAAALAGTDGIRNLLKRKKALEKYDIGSKYEASGLTGVVKKHTWTHLVIFTDQAERVHVPYLRAVRAKR